MEPKTVGSLFSGCGGLDLGLELAGFQVKFQCESNYDCIKVLKRHWPDVPKYIDVTDLPYDKLPKVTLLVGGDPCQENSRANNTGRTTAPSLGNAYISAIERIRPRLVLRENPPARRDAPWPASRFASALEQLGYVVLPFRLRACCLGADHRRERVFLLGHLTNAVCKGLERDGWGEEKSFGDIPYPTGSAWGTTYTGIRRMADGFPSDVDTSARLRMLGNAVEVRTAWFIGTLLMRNWRWV